MGRRSDIKPLPSLERLNELLSYDEHTGILTWKMLPATSRSNIGFNNAGSIFGRRRMVQIFRTASSARITAAE